MNVINIFYKLFQKSLACPDLDLVIIGKAGIGKSATGNSILRQQEEFKTNYNANPEVRNPQYRTTIIDGRTVQVVECPGVIDIDIDKRGGVERVVRAIQNAVLANPEGYHAFLIVVAFSQRFYKQELDCIKILKHILGENVIKTHGVIVMCRGDNFKYHEIAEKLTVTKFCQKQEGAFKELLDECNQRVVVFDNSTNDESIQTKQLKNLVLIIDELKSSRHTAETFVGDVAITALLQKEKKLIIDQNIILQKLLYAKRNKKTPDELITLKETIDELLIDIDGKCGKRKIFGLLKLNMADTRNYIEKCVANPDLNYAEFWKIEREFKDIKRESDEGFFHKCLNQLEENDCYPIEKYKQNF